MGGEREERGREEREKKGRGAACPNKNLYRNIHSNMFS